MSTSYRAGGRRGSPAIAPLRLPFAVHATRSLPRLDRVGFGYRYRTSTSRTVGLISRPSPRLFRLGEIFLRVSSLALFLSLSLAREREREGERTRVRVRGNRSVLSRDRRSYASDGADSARLTRGFLGCNCHLRTGVNVRACVSRKRSRRTPRDEFRAILTPVFTGQYPRCELERDGDARSGEEGLFGAK